MKILTFLNEKGGVGKTTIASTIGAGLAIMGYRILLVDADPQGHLTISFGIKKQHSLYDLLVRDAEFNDAGIVHPISPDVYGLPDGKNDPNGRLFIVPGNRETRLISQALDSEPFAIRTRMMELEQEGIIDYVIFDTSPTPSAFHAMIYLATDHIFYPTEVTYLSFDGLVASIQSTTGYSKKRQQSGLNAIKLSGIIPTKYRNKTLEHREKYEALKKRYPDLVWEPLPMSVVWEESLARRRSIFNYAFDHPITTDAWRIVNNAKESLTSG